MSYFPTKQAFLTRGLQPYINAYSPSSTPATPQNISLPLTSGPLFPTSQEPSTAAPTQEEERQRTSTPTLLTHPLSTDGALNCPICLETLTDICTPVTIRICTHAYHESCLRLWLADHNTCPTCRRILYGPPPLQRRYSSSTAHTPEPTSSETQRQHNEMLSILHEQDQRDQEWFAQRERELVQAEEEEQAYALAMQRTHGVPYWGGPRGDRRRRVWRDTNANNVSASQDGVDTLIEEWDGLRRGRGRGANRGRRRGA